MLFILRDIVKSFFLKGWKDFGQGQQAESANNAPSARHYLACSVAFAMELIPAVGVGADGSGRIGARSEAAAGPSIRDLIRAADDVKMTRPASRRFAIAVHVNSEIGFPESSHDKPRLFEIRIHPSQNTAKCQDESRNDCEWLFLVKTPRTKGEVRMLSCCQFISPSGKGFGPF